MDEIKFFNGQQLAIKSLFCHMLLSWDIDDVNSFISVEKYIREKRIARDLDKDSLDGYDSIMGVTLALAKFRVREFQKEVGETEADAGTGKERE